MNSAIYCPSCGARFGDRTTAHQCSHCEGPLSLSLGSSSFPRELIRNRPPDLWRYAEAIPAFPHPVSLGEPMTPLVPFELGGTEVLAKCEFLQATGSYKDRGSAFLVSHLRSVGVSDAVEDSSGNAGASLAAYAARAGVRLQVYCPASASAGKLVQIQLYGARLRRIEGPRPRATEALLAHIEESGAVYASHLWQPLFIEGVKTMAFEMTEQLGWTAPDAVLCPVGAGSILLGLYKGFRELRQAGVIARLPRLVAVQAHHVSSVYQAFVNGADRVVPAADRKPTLAEGIALPGPVRDREVLEALRESGGTVVTVSEDEIAEGTRRFGAAGFCVEPTSAVVWKGVEKVRSEGLAGHTDSVVVVLSGHGLKASQAVGGLLAGA